MTTVTAWCSSRSRRATAVVCSGRKRPQGLEGPAAGDAEAATLAGSGHEPEEQLRTDIIEGREAEVIDDDEVGPQEALHDAPDAVVGEAPIERLDERGSREVAHAEGPGIGCVALILALREADEADPIQVRTAQKTFSGPSSPQSMTRCSPGTGTQGRYVRRSRRQAALAAATARRRLRGEPRYPAARQRGRRRLALMRPSVARIRSATRSAPGSVLRRLGGRSAGGWPRRSTTRRTVLWVVPQSAAVARYEPSSWYLGRMSNRSLAVFTMGIPRASDEA